MQNKITLKYFKSIIKKVFFVLLSILLIYVGKAQTISTAGGTNYAGNFSINNAAPLIESFVIKNTNATDVVLTTVNTQMANYFTATAGLPSVNKLFYSSTSLSGVFDVSTPAWTQIGAGTSIVPAALTVLPAVTCMNFVIPAGAEYRFALEMTKGMAFSFTPTPTPNTFTVGGVILKLGDAQIAGSAVGYAGLSPVVPAGNAGAFFGGSVVLVPAGACTGTPNPGNTISTVASSCSGVPFNLSLQNCLAGSGITYQWQSAASATGPWTNIAGATVSSLGGVVVTATTFYRCLVTCSGNTGTSTPVQVALAPLNQCYCASNATSTADEDIFRVALSTLNNSSTCTSVAPGPGSLINRYSNYASGVGAPAIPNVTAGGTYPLTVQIGTCGGNFTNSVAAWIDFNQDGVLAATERVYISAAGTAGPHTETGNIFIPGNALTGNTRLRVVNVETGTPTTITACGTYTWGETEDYTINIQPCVPIGITAQPVSTTIGCGESTSYSITTTGTFPTYQWEYKAVGAGSIWLPVPAAAPYAVVNTTTTSTLNITNAPESLSGYQYRAVFNNACAGIDFSSAATLTVSPYVPPISPAAPKYCAGGSIQLYASAPPSVTTVTSASNLNLHIIDGAIAGINHTLAVAGIPAGAVITNITVNTNIQHTYVADLELVLRAPNGRILNLSNLLGGANGPGANFTNTKFSSAAGLPALITGIAPGYTGTFKPDGGGPVGAFGVPGGPTGFLPTAGVTSFAGLNVNTGADANGNWTLAMYDAGPPDEGDLKDWSISITWGVTPATGVFSPLTNLWLDAGLTVPYTGTAVNSVYTNAPASTTYTAVISNGTCIGNATFPVTVYVPLAGTLSTANVTACAGTNATFAYTGLTAGTGLTYQWQVNTIANPTFTNIAGATGATYTVSGATVAQNGNKYRVIVAAGTCVATLTSSAGTLTVNTNPVVTISAAPIVNLFPGLTSTLTAAVSSATAPITYQWTRNGSPVAGATANTTVVTIDGLGAYTVNVKDANGCVNTGGVTTPASIAISDSANTDRLFIYPSPNSGQFQVRFYNDPNKGSIAPSIVNVYDERGSKVYSKTFIPSVGYLSMKVDLGIHGKGVYRVDLLDINGARIKTGSVLVF
jgi:subtilisin-like proprotein convertase family protein